MGAILMPMIPVLIGMLVLGKRLDQNGIVAVMLIAVPAVLAAQSVVFLRWKALQRRALAAQSAWPTGLGMALLTHVLFGFYLALAFILFVGPDDWIGSGNLWQLPVQALFFGFSSLMIAGAVSLPMTAWLAHAIGRLREKELALESR